MPIDSADDSNVSDAQINRGVCHFGPKFRGVPVFPLEQTRHVMVAKSEHPRIIN